MIKILTNSPPADNGNKFLCENCKWASIRSGTHAQKQISCQQFNGEMEKVTFRVTQCTEHMEADPFTTNPVKAMIKQAWFIDASTEGRGITLVPPDEAKRRGLLYE